MAPWNGIDLDSSDRYEEMPEQFQKLITKMHPKLNKMMLFWKKFVIFREKPDDPLDKIYETVMTKLDIRCDVCFTFLTTNRGVVKHIKDNHFDIIDSGRNQFITGK